MPVVAAVLIEPDGDPKKVLRVTLPLGMSIQPGTRVIVDSGQPMTGPYVICFNNGCMADYEASGELIGKLKKGQGLVVQGINGAGQPISLVVPLGDFAKAYDGPPTDPKVFETQQKKLQDELEKRAEEARRSWSSNRRRPPGNVAVRNWSEKRRALGAPLLFWMLARRFNRRRPSRSTRAIQMNDRCVFPALPVRRAVATVALIAATAIAFASSSLAQQPPAPKAQPKTPPKGTPAPARSASSQLPPSRSSRKSPIRPGPRSARRDQSRKPRQFASSAKMAAWSRACRWSRRC